MNPWILIALLGPLGMVPLFLELMGYVAQEGWVDWRKDRLQIYIRIFYLIYAGIVSYFSTIFFIHLFLEVLA